MVNVMEEDWDFLIVLGACRYITSRKARAKVPWLVIKD